MSQFYFFDPERREKIRLTGTNAKPYHTTFHVIKCLLYDLAFSSANPKCTHFSPSSFYGKLPSWKLEELQITVHTNNPALLDACCPVNNQQAFSVRTIIAWSSLWTWTNTFSTVCHGFLHRQWEKICRVFKFWQEEIKTFEWFPVYSLPFRL